MKTIYIDHDEKYNGNGSLNRPFNTIEELYGLQIEHPVTILIKKGNVFHFSLTDLNGIFYNNTSEKSFLSSYGEGSNPVWITKSKNESHIHTNKIQNVTITNMTSMHMKVEPKSLIFLVYLQVISQEIVT